MIMVRTLIYVGVIFILFVCFFVCLMYTNFICKMPNPRSKPLAKASPCWVSCVHGWFCLELAKASTVSTCLSPFLSTSYVGNSTAYRPASMTLSYVLALLTPYYILLFLSLNYFWRTKNIKDFIAKENAKKTPTRGNLMQPRTLRD